MDKRKVKIGILLGTTRLGRQSEKVYKYISELLEHKFSEEVEIFLFDIRFLFSQFDKNNFSFNKEAIEKYQDFIKKIDGLILISPEYNHSFPGELKMVLDLEYQIYRNKPVIVVGVSSGPIGGARMCESLIPVLRTIGFRVYQYDILFPNINNYNFEDSREEERLLKQLKDFIHTIN
ncbi:MAG: NAD(P)H-dependent oxidoreductase [Candidatus Dojkabacteria bacterium]|nr:NAD(P)H-dependent oxidoreductase [Candidatus Dojkabacteria bacterium]